jgi:hypothetical protein
MVAQWHGRILLAHILAPAGSADNSPKGFQNMESIAGGIYTGETWAAKERVHEACFSGGD